METFRTASTAVPRKTFRFIPQLLLLAALALVLAGCSRVGFLYQQLDWLVPFYVESKVSLDDLQRSDLESQVERLLVWHCANHLRDYAQLLREANSDFAARRMTAARVSDYLRRLENYWSDILTQVLPALTDLLHRASDGQVEELFDAFEERNREARKRYADENREKLEADYRKRMTDELERWFGPLTAQQEEFLSRWLRDFRAPGAEGLASRLRWQHRLRSLLENRRDRISLRAGLEELFRRTDRFRTPSYQALLERNRDVTVALVVRMGETLEGSQLTHLAREVESYASDFERLACDGAAPEQAKRERPNIGSPRLPLAD